MSTNQPTALEAAFLLTGPPLSLFARYVDCSDALKWTTEEWAGNVAIAAAAWDADGRPQSSLANRCKCGRTISGNKDQCLACKNLQLQP